MLHCFGFRGSNKSITKTFILIDAQLTSEFRILDILLKLLDSTSYNKKLFRATYV